ncbi:MULTISPECIES: MarR family transcriptional regulator [Bacillaceae]|uniref:MarR family winged helix-turn-helix transcriptional regulator n=1 Tax=Bacillaceae TaxID=186817 RepID=UPI001E51E5EA|nr:MULTISPECIES: MarR family transcriptional regulator [Bacillaceae]MCE4050906.1 MarR family transcriptional regulator [Bacillus sp. Au-Bac7]MCM3029360.1 MarR family transcriptional regulator [Niallia sp. MER 6]MDL0434455.1 MarR family transcriptional regulator [Niallia sp. SS-2023]UPO88572.1 MarR family transcriptional regulator [Niallia sp. Man26]
MSNDCLIQLQIFYQLQKLNNNVNTKFESCLGSSPTRIEILHCLYNADEISQSALQKEVNIDNAAVTRHLKQLEAAGLISRRKKAEDNRVTLVSLTEGGREEITVSLQAKKSFIEQTLNGFSSSEQETLLDMLSRLSKNVSTVEI